MRTRLILVVAVMALLAACGGDGADDTTTTAGETPDTTQPDAEDPDDGEDEPAAGGTIDMWIAFTDDTRLGFAEDKAAEFSAAHEGYTVNVQAFDSYEVLFQQAQLAIADGNPPAIIHFFEAATQEAWDAVDADGNKIFKSVTEAIGGRDEILGVPVVLDDVVGPVRNYYTLDGEFYSMPWNTSSAIMFSNMTLLGDLGITEIPETWAEMEAVCEQIIDADLAGCVTWPNHAWFIEQTMGQMGANLASNDNGRDGRADEILLDSEAMNTYFGWWSEMADAGHYVYTGARNDWAGTAALFQAQEVPFIIYSSSDTAPFTQGGVDGGYEVVASRFPYNQDVPYVGNLIGGATLWLVNGLDPDVEEGALAFLNFFINPENDAEWHQVSGYVPVTEGGVAHLEAEGWFEQNPNFRVASDQLAMADLTPASTGILAGNFVAIRDVMTQAAEQMLVGSDDPSAVLDQAQVSAQRLLDEYNLLYSD